MDKKSKFGLILSILNLIVIGFLCWKCYKYSTSIQESNEINKQYIEYLENKVDSLSKVEKEIDLQIDTITVTIEKTKIKYEKEHNTILNNTPSEDYRFFTEYIDSNRERLYHNK